MPVAISEFWRLNCIIADDSVEFMWIVTLNSSFMG